jgi:hypothetical protein
MAVEPSNNNNNNNNNNKKKKKKIQSSKTRAKRYGVEKSASKFRLEVCRQKINGGGDIGSNTMLMIEVLKYKSRFRTWWI